MLGLVWVPAPPAPAAWAALLGVTSCRTLRRAVAVDLDETMHLRGRARATVWAGRAGAVSGGKQCAGILVRVSPPAAALPPLLRRLQGLGARQGVGRRLAQAPGGEQGRRRAPGPPATALQRLLNPIETLSWALEAEPALGRPPWALPNPYLLQKDPAPSQAAIGRRAGGSGQAWRRVQRR